MASPAPRKKKELQAERQRQLQREADITRLKAQQRNRWKKHGMRVGGVILALAAIAAAVAYALKGSASSVDAHTVSTALGEPTSDVASQPLGQFTKAGTSIVKNGKPELLFVGAQYCPHCAGQRWAVVKALDQFGTFAQVKSSSSEDGSIPTFDLLNATYTSKYVYFDHKDIEDRSHNQLQQLDGTETSLYNALDPTGGIPLVAVGGYALIGDGFDIGLISGKSFSAVQNGLQQGDAAPWSYSINAEVNAITAFICHADGMKPSAVCGRPGVRSIVRTLHG